MLNRLNDRIDRFCALHPNFGIPGLMRYVVGGNVLVYLLTIFSNEAALEFLWLDVGAVLHGEVWRIITFIFVPTYGSVLFMAIALYFYYFLGTTLENQWGTAKFTIYYLLGVLLTVLVTFISYFCFRSGIVAGADYVDQSLFFAFAMLYPEMQVLLFFVIPIKVKWIAIVDAVWFGISIVLSLISGNIIGALLPVVAMLNFLIFFAPRFRQVKEREAYRHSAKAQQYRRDVRSAQNQAREQARQGYHHKCCVCGRTDSEYPDLQFRYCSRCAGYHCYCSDHIFNHIHFTEETDS